MGSVTARIKEVKQPRGGYIKPSSMDVTNLDDGKTLSMVENVHPIIIGIAVDYMTRFMMGTSIDEAFEISISGAKVAEWKTGKKALEEIEGYLRRIKGLDDESIINACKAATFDAWFRSPAQAMLASGAKETYPNKDTIINIKILIERSLSFWEKYGPIKALGFTFGEKGYTRTVSVGDGDYLTEDTIWDFKVSNSAPKSQHTLQLLMYYVMGKHSEKPEFKGITKIGIFNPRLNRVYQYDVSNVPPETIKIIENEIICY